jgi:rhamnose transport system permease protein
VLLIIVALISPSFFSTSNLRDLALNNAATLIIAIGMTMIILAGQIDISVGSQFAVCSLSAGWLATLGVPVPLLLPVVMLIGAAMGALNGFLAGLLRLPSIIVTLAMMVALRDGLRWTTEGAWVQDLPSQFQWLGLGQTAGRSSGSRDLRGRI